MKINGKSKWCDVVGILFDSTGKLDIFEPVTCRWETLISLCFLFFILLSNNSHRIWKTYANDLVKEIGPINIMNQHRGSREDTTECFKCGWNLSFFPSMAGKLFICGTLKKKKLLKYLTNLKISLIHWFR